MRQIQEAANYLRAKLFRNNVGAFKDRRGQWIRFGLCKGSSDLIGWRSVVITPEMVGKTVAVFASAEVKLPSTRVTKEQELFIEEVKAAGGIAFIARSIDDLQRGFNGEL